MADDPLAPIRHEPATSALFFDVDGVLAPIAPRPELARVPLQWLAALEELRERYGLVGCVSGRPLGTLRELVPVPRLLLAADHRVGLHLGPGRAPPPGVGAL